MTILITGPPIPTGILESGRSPVRILWDFNNFSENNWNQTEIEQNTTN